MSVDVGAARRCFLFEDQVSAVAYMNGIFSFEGLRLCDVFRISRHEQIS